MTITVSAAGKDMLGDICAAERECFSDPWSRESLEEAFLCPDRIFLAAADENGAFCGYLIGISDGMSGYIERIAVCAAARRKGAGRALVTAFSERIGGDAPISLDVRESNLRAIAFYESCGFERAGIRKRLYSAPTENGVVMIKKKGA